MLLVLDLVPGLSLGPFILGMSLSKAVKHVREKKAEYRCVEVKYADQALLEHDLILNFPEHGMHLRFDPSSQRLRLIEVYDVSRMQLRYGRGVLGGASHAATALLVYELMGPTFPGQYDATSGLYSIFYPGLLVLFPIPKQHAEHVATAELHLEFPDDTTPVASRICIYAGTAGSAQEVAEAIPPPLPRGSVSCQPVDATVGRGLSFSVGGQQVSFGDSPQDVCSELGSPSGTVQKPVDPHLGHHPRLGSAAADYFYTYEERGIDILFDGTRHRVKKIVLRTNAPGHSEFNAYSKCNFRLKLEPRAPEPETPDDSARSDRMDVPSANNLATDSYSEDGSSDERDYLAASEAAREGLIAPNAEGDPPQARSPAAAGPDQRSKSEPGIQPVKSTMQGVIQDFFASPTATPGKGHGAASEEARGGWGAAADWTLNLLDITGEPPLAPNTTPATDQGTGSFWDYQPATPGSLAKGHAIDVPVEEFYSPGKDEGFKSEQDAASQRDGWDELDTSMLEGLELGNPSTAGQETPQMQSGSEAGIHVEMPPSTTNVEIVSLSSGASTGARGSRQEQPAVGRKDDKSWEREPGFDRVSDFAMRKGQQLPVISADTLFQDVQAIMGDAGLATVHTRGLGSNPFARTHVHGYPGVAFEVLRNGHVASMTLFQV